MQLPSLQEINQRPYCLLGLLPGAGVTSQAPSSPAHLAYRASAMAAVVIPGQPRRWGNESTNFFQHSRTEAPGVASKQKVYRCDGNQYTNCGHYHLGTKAVNL